MLELIADDELDVDFFWPRLVIEAHAKGDLREQAAIQDYLVATPRALAALVGEIASSKNADDRSATWLRGPEPLAAIEEAALTGPDAAGRFSEAHLVLEGRR